MFYNLRIKKPAQWGYQNENAEAYYLVVFKYIIWGVIKWCHLKVKGMCKKLSFEEHLHGKPAGDLGKDAANPNIHDTYNIPSS